MVNFIKQKFKWTNGSKVNGGLVKTKMGGKVVEINFGARTLTLLDFGLKSYCWENKQPAPPVEDASSWARMVNEVF